MKTKNANTMTIDGHEAVITYQAEGRAFRGKFLGLTGHCDFVSTSIDGLEKEGRISLAEYIETCREEGIEPFEKEEKTRSFTLRYPESLEPALKSAAEAREVSRNQLIVDLLQQELHRA